LVLHNEEATAFDSQKPLPGALQNEKFEGEAAKEIAPTEEELGEISAALRRASGVQLIGFDLLRRESDRKLVLVDFNYFPCFRGIDDIPGKFAAFIKRKAGRA
jgi:glutathione synthase/RimK-type ligase-like ATP-grasp enzyme